MGSFGPQTSARMATGIGRLSPQAGEREFQSARRPLVFFSLGQFRLPGSSCGGEPRSPRSPKRLRSVQELLAEDDAVACGGNDFHRPEGLAESPQPVFVQITAIEVKDRLTAGTEAAGGCR